MKLLDWKNPLWRKRFWALLTVVVIAFLATNPEFRLLVPVLDAIGLDVFFILVEVQLLAIVSGVLNPVFRQAWRFLGPVLRVADRASRSVGALRLVRGFARYGVFHWTGKHGPEAWLRFHKLVRAARIGAGPSFRPVGALAR